MTLKYIIMTSLFILMGHNAQAQNNKLPTWSNPDNLDGTCYYDDDGALVIKGNIGTKIYLCLDKNYRDDTETIIVNSSGGSAVYGIFVSHILQDKSFKLIIDKRCNSACALHIIPHAKELYVPKDAGIVLHGAPIYSHTAEEKKRTIENMIRNGDSPYEAEKSFQRQEKYGQEDQIFAEKIRKKAGTKTGWLMQKGQWIDQKADNIVNDKFYVWLEQNDVNGLLVDRLMLETCLPNVTIKEFYGPSHPEIKKDTKFQDRIKKANLAIRPYARCLDTDSL